MSDCIFCRIVTGDAPASFVHRDDLVTAFMDNRPVTPGHLLVIPNEHVVSTHELPDAAADRLFAVGRRLAQALRVTDAIRTEGTNFFVADGEAIQTVFHAHLHVIPRIRGDGFVVGPRGDARNATTTQQLDVMAAVVRAALSETGDGAPQRIRPIVIGLALKDERVFAIEGLDSRRGQRFYRPPGGGIEFGETGEQALHREFREEFDVKLTSVSYLGALENIFTYEGRPGHEIVLVYRIEIADDDRFTLETVAGAESDGSSFEARWLPLADVRAGTARLYPDGLLDLLDHGRGRAPNIGNTVQDAWDTVDLT